jgi:hypothetical protein
VTVGFGRKYALYHEIGTRRMTRRGLLLADTRTGTLAQADIGIVLDTLGRHFGI